MIQWAPISGLTFQSDSGPPTHRARFVGGGRAEKAMGQVYSDFVRALDPAGTPPDADVFEDVWRALASTLGREIRRRGLWQSSPTYLGIAGHAHWADEAVEELVAPCYEHVFIRRLGGLLAQLRVKDNIDGLVVLHVRNYLHDTQKRQDPLGFRIYNILRSAIRLAIEADEVHVLAGDRRMRSDTLLAFGSAPPGPEVPSAYEAAPESPLEPKMRECLAPIIERWNALLLPELVTAQGPAQAAVADQLARRLRDLPAAGIDVIRFGDLIRPMEYDVRGRWAALLDQDLGPAAFDDDADGMPRLVRRLDPGDTLLAQQHFDALVACISEAIERQPGSTRAKQYLEILWQFLRSWSLDEGETAGPTLPSRRKLATLLRIPRDRLGPLFETLEELMSGCRTAIDGQGAVNSHSSESVSADRRREAS